MTNAKGEKLTEAGPSVPVEIIGMSEVPGAGDDFHAVADERMARELVEQRKAERKDALSSNVGKVTLEDLFSQIQAGEMKNLNVIVKADVQGSAEAVKASLEKLTNEEVRVRVIHCAVGAISESDVMLAGTSGAIIVGFNVRPDNNAKDSAARMGVDMRMYRVIYDAIGEVEAAMKGMLAPQVPGGPHRPRRGAADLQGVRRGHHRRLLRPGRQDSAVLPGAYRPGWHRHPRGDAGVSPAVQGCR